MEQIPKILVIGQPFNKKSGGGITMSNLFQGWPKERLSIASNENLLSELDKSFCEQYYQLGYNNKLHPFPINIILPKIYCGSVISSFTNDTKQNQVAEPGKYRTIYKFLSSFLKFIGIYNILYKLEITPDFISWLNEYNPDIIYSQLSTLELIRFMMEIKKLINKPVAIHMMDDWPVTINKPGLFKFYWKRVIDREFRELLDNSSILMSICESMSDEYRIRYKKEFIPFHNPIETRNWLPFSKKSWIIKDKFTILYAGRIGLGMKNTISEMASAVNDFCRKNDNVIFEIQTNDIGNLKKIVKFNDHIRWVKPIEYNDLPEKFSSVDMLILPVDFEPASIKFMKYSFPTKITEYMISGTPILVFADKRTTVAKYAIKESWAYVVTENNKMLLTNAISDLYSDINLRKELGERAKSLAIQNEDAQVIRENFRKCFIVDKLVS